jgi:hypothetical protein
MTGRSHVAVPDQERADDFASAFLAGAVETFIAESGGRPIKAGQSFIAAQVGGYFHTIDAMHAVYSRYKGHTALSVDGSGWRLVE